jgi:adenosylcobinamide kinase/adenosylcobinamide-phosphate guanylyltransferase
MPHLILGGARSGKSRHAQRLAEQSGLAVTVIATGQAGDAEMAARIARHRAERPPHWRTVEQPLHLAAALRQAAGPGSAEPPRSHLLAAPRGGAMPALGRPGVGQCVLVDCLTLWLMNLLEAGETVFARERAALLETLPTLSGEILLVANEVGLGVIPLGELSRRFVDEAGWLNQDIARLSKSVTFVAAGLPLALKSPVKESP